MKQIHLKLFVYLLLVVQATANPYGAAYSGARSSFNPPVIGSELTSGMTSNIGLVGPVPAMGDNRGFTLNTCFNIIDAEFPGFSNYCSVLPQTTYALPNFFGHQTKPEVNQLLSAMKSTLDSGCFSHVRMFVCPLFFPPCGDAPVLPCAQFCQTVKSRCASPELESIDCSALPAQSRFCPVVISSNSPRTAGFTGNSYSYGSNRNIIASAPTQTTYSSSSQQDSTISESSYGSSQRSFTSTIAREVPSSYGQSVSGAASSFAPSMTLAKSFSSYGGSVQEAPKVLVRSSSSYGSSAPLAPPKTIVKSFSSYGGGVQEAPKVLLGGQSFLGKTLLKNTENSYGSSSFDSSSSSSYGSSAPLAPPKTIVKSFSSYGGGFQEAPKVLLGGQSFLGKTLLKNTENSYGSSSFDSSSSSSYGSSAPLAPPKTIVKSFSSYGGGVQEAPKVLLGGSSSLNNKFLKDTSSNYGSSSFDSSSSSSSSSSYGSSSSSSFAPMKTFTLPFDNRGLQMTRTNFGGSSYGGGSNSPSINSNSYGYGASYGIQSTGSEETYVEAPLDLTKCGTVLEDNPCSSGGPQFFPLSSTPFCYIHCDGPYMFVKPCPGELVWNAGINTCDWPSVIEVPATPSLNPIVSNYGSAQLSNTNTQSGYSYGRKKRATKERKKRFFPFLPEFLDPVASKVPLGPPLPGIVPLPGFIGPIGLPGPLYPPFFPPFLFPPLGPLVPPLLPPPIVPGLPPPIGGPGVPPPAGPAPAPAPAAPPAYGQQGGYGQSAPAPAPAYGQQGGYGQSAPPSGPAYGPGDNYAAQQAPPSGPAYGPGDNYAPQQAPPSGPAYGPSNNYAPAPAAPAPAPAAPVPPVGPAIPPIAPGPIIPSPLIPPLIPMLPPFPPPFFGMFPPHGRKYGSKYGGKYGSKYGGKYDDRGDDFLGGLFGGGSFGGPFGPIGAEPLFHDPLNLDLGGGFPFGEDFYGGSPGPFFEPIPFPGGCKSKRRNGKCDSTSYGKKDYDDDYASYDGDYGYSKKSSYKKNGNFKSYGSKNDYSYKKKYNDDYDSYDGYRKKRQYSYGSKMTEERPVIVPQSPKVFTSSYGSGIQESRAAIPMQPLRPAVEVVTFSPCANHQGKGNIPHPSDATKYIACLNTEKYEIMDCPEGLIYDAENDQCKKANEEETLCDRLKPCMNEGQCYVTGPSAYKCTCRNGWTGENCEIPLSSCASNPCGAGNECHPLNINDFKQDYVCVCDGRSSYGSTCERNTVPNPCMALSSEQQYYAFAFSSHAYVQCNGELLAFQPCPSGLYWNQENKVCDRELSLNMPLEQPDSYQTNYKVEPQIETFTRTAPVLVEEIIERPQANRYRNYNTLMTNERSSGHFNPVFVRPEAPMIIDRSYAATPKVKPIQHHFQTEETSYTSNNAYSNSNERRETFIEQQGYQAAPLLPKMTWSMRPATRVVHPSSRSSSSSYRR